MSYMPNPSKTILQRDVIKNNRTKKTQQQRKKCSTPPTDVPIPLGFFCFYDQPYLLAVSWAIAGIASKVDYRFVQLGKDLSDGVNVALQGLWIGLLCIGVLGILAGVRHMNRAEAEVMDKRRPIPSAPSNPADRDLTSVIYSA